ncbi:MAG: TIGR01212 family radical SAM protein [Rikenellaceae bacterium]
MYSWGDERRFNSYARYFSRIFGSRIQKLSVNAGFSCPNRDGYISTGGCSFCNNEAFSPSYCKAEKSVKQQLEEGIEFHANRYRKASSYLAYFQSFSNTYAPLEHLKQIYNQALEFDCVKGIVVGTRPDCVDEYKLDYFAQLIEKGYYVSIEYGIESTNDKVLKDINRGHDFATAQRAVEMTAQRGINVGAHFILGLPSESKSSMLESLELINALELTTVKFHQLQMFKGTAMAEDYALNPDDYSFFELEEYLDFFIEILVRLNPSFVLERFVSEAPPRFHAGPNWGIIRNEQIMSRFEKLLLAGSVAGNVV